VGKKNGKESRKTGKGRREDK